MPVTAPNLVEVNPPGEMDSDGDGHPDAVSTEPGIVAVARADGVVRFSQPGSDMTVQGWADFDGDGRDDPVLSVAAPAGSSRDWTLYVISGDLSAGTYQPNQAGVKVDGRFSQPWPQDLDGVAGDDFVVPVRSDTDSSTSVYSGAEIMARGPGGDATGIVPARQLPGLVRAVATLGPGQKRETLLYLPGRPAAVLFAARPRARLSALGPGTSRVEDIVVFDEDGTRKIGLHIDGRVAVWAVPPACP